jgi:hypothetical protein
MSGRRGRARRGVRTENVVQEEDPDNPRVIYRALRTACLGTLLKWDPAQNPRAGGDSSEGYLREPVGPLVIGFDTMLCVCHAGYKVSQKLRVKAGWLTGVMSGQTFFLGTVPKSPQLNLLGHTA